VNQTIGQKATQLRLGADGFFSSAVPVTEGKNQIDVLARASDGGNTRESITVYYQPGTQKSLELEVFLEKEKNLQLEVDRLGKSSAEIQREVERNREDTLRRPEQLPPPSLMIDITFTVSPNKTSLSPRRITVLSARVFKASCRVFSKASSLTTF